jgi:Zn finger protein HypA/HybF involved in hydrogenase expression
MKLKDDIKTASAESRYKCDECGWVGTRKEMTHEMGDYYDQDCCPVCNDIMFDDFYGKIYCEKI